MNPSYRSALLFISLFTFSLAFGSLSGYKCEGLINDRNVGKNGVYNMAVPTNGTITGDATVCINSQSPVITFTGIGGTAPYAFVYQINGGAELTISTANNRDNATINAPINASGTFIYTLLRVRDATNTYLDVSGTATIVVSNEIPANPVITPGGTSEVCPEGIALRTDNIPGLRYQWNLNGSPISNANSYTYLATRDGSYTVTITNAGNCSATSGAKQVIAVVPSLGSGNPSTVFKVFENREYFTQCTFKFPDFITVSNSTLHPELVQSYTIDWGDNTTNTELTTFTTPQTHSYAAGFYTLTLTLRTIQGNTCSRTYGVFVGNNPSGTLKNPGSLSGCAPYPITFGIDAPAENIPGTRYHIDFGDGQTVTYYHPDVPESVTHTYTTSSCGSNPNNSIPNSFLAKMIITNPCYPPAVTTVSPIIIHSPPIPDITVSPNPACLNSIVSIRNTSTPGSYVGENGCDSNSRYYWTISPSTGWTTTSILGSDGGNPNDYGLWQGGSSTLAVRFTAAGNYTVTLYTSNGCGVVNSTQRVICAQSPVVPRFTIDRDQGCIPLIVNTSNTTDFTNACSAPAYNWSVSYQANPDHCGTTSAFTYESGTTSSSANPSFQFTNPGIYTISLSTNAACGTPPSTRTVRVSRPPAVSINPISNFCGSASFTPVANIRSCNPASNALTYLWSFPGATLANSTSLNPGTITYDRPGSYTISMSATNDCGVSNTATTSFVVNERPTITNTALAQTICSGLISAPVTLTSNLANVTYSWTATATPGITGYVPSGRSNTIPASVILNSGNSAGTVTYTITPLAGNCSGDPVQYVITVNPSPGVNFSLPDQTICSGSNTQAVMLSSTTSGAVLSWTAVQQTGILGMETSGTDAVPVQTLINTTGAPVSVTYRATATVSGTVCTGVEYAYTITVNPGPDIRESFSSEICSGNAFSISPSNGANNRVPVGTRYTWDSPVITPAGSITGGSRQDTPQQVIGQTLVNNTASVARATYRVTPIMNNCSGTPFELNVSVNPSATINPVTNLTLCHNDPSEEIIFTGSLPGTLYRWTSDNTSIGIAGLGSERIPSFTAVNTGNSPQTATITVTPSLESGILLCDALPVRFTITVNPVAQVNNPGIQNACNQRNASVNFTTDNTGGITTYQWTSSNIGIGLAGTGNGNISFTPINTGNSILSTTITVIPTFVNNGVSCMGNSEEFTLAINPTPTVSQPNDQVVCNSFRTAEVIFNGNITNEIFNWTNDNVSIGLAANGSGNISEFIAVNTGSAPAVARITVTPSLNGCNGESRIFSITVNPSPVITRQPASSTICLGEAPALLSVQYTNGTGTPTYQWYSHTLNSSTGGTLIQGATSATFMPPSTTANRRYYYCVITFPTGGCNRLTTDVARVTINRRPVISSMSEAIGSGETFTVVPDSLTGDIVPLGTTYTWSEPVINPANSVSGASSQPLPQSAISQQLTNHTTAAATVTYMVTPTSGSCAGNAFPVVVTINPPLNPNATIQPLTCFGANDGSIRTRIQGGVPFATGDPYVVQWTGPGGFTSTQASVTNLRPGLYQLVFTDAMGMRFSSSYTINEPGEIIVVTGLEKDITCFGASDGEIQISSSGGTGVHTYTWTRNNVLFSNNKDITNLSPGIYRVSVTDINHCNPVVLSYTITEPEVLAITLLSQTDIRCYGESTGAVSVNVRGGRLIETSPGIFDYRYQWTGPEGFVSSEKDLYNIPSGIYHLTVTDNSGCTQVFSATITQPDDILVTPVTTPISCYGANNASITLNIEGGVSPYTARWNNYASGTFQDNLSAGDYTITVTDANNCREIITVTIPEAPVFRITPQVKNVSCYGANDGSITLNYEGKEEPITLTWSDQSTSGTTRNNIGPGTYSVIIDGGDLCMINRTFVITEPGPMTISPVVKNALECDRINGGAIDILVNGGTPPYRYAWSNGARTEDLANIPGGSYAVTVTDSVGCVSVGQFNVTRPLPMDINLVTNLNYDCTSKTVTAVNRSSVTGGVPPYLVKWSRGVVSLSDQDVMQTTQGGYVTITVTDTLGCTAEKTFDVQVPDLGMEYQVLNCNSRTGQFNAVVVDEAVRYTYSWDFGDGSISDLKNPQHTFRDPGIYKVRLTVVSPDLCMNIYEKNILVESLPQVTLDRQPKFCTGDSLLVYALGADGYRWNDGSTGDSIWIKNPGQYSVEGTSMGGCTFTYNFTASLYDTIGYSITSDISEVTNEQNVVHFWTQNILYSDYIWDFGDSLSATGYDVYHTYDINRDGFFEVKLKVINPDGCIEEAQKNISISLASFANTFTPNGDGINDIYLKGWQTEIYNRNGILLYRGPDGWDGTHNGKPVANDTYFVIIYDSAESGAKYKTNYVTVLR